VTRRAASSRIRAGSEPSGRTPALTTRGRKVRAPQGRVLANGQPRRLAGQRHREQTTRREAGKGETVR